VEKISIEVVEFDSRVRDILVPFLTGLDDGMLVVGVDSTEVVVFVCDYDDLPVEDRPPPALVIES
jgi:hypothetical protein